MLAGVVVFLTVLTSVNGVRRASPARFVNASLYGRDASSSDANSVVAVAALTNPWIGSKRCESWPKCCDHNWKEGSAPSGCSTNLVGATYALAKFVAAHGYTLELYGGTLIGAMRCGEIIPWDYDADMKIYVPTAAAEVELAKAINAWDGGPDLPKFLTVTIDGHMGGTKLYQWGATPHKIHLGVYIRVGSSQTIPCVLNDVMAYHSKPHVVLHCPANYNEVLTAKYGPDWKSVPKRWQNWPHTLASGSRAEDSATMKHCQQRMVNINAKLATMR